MALLEVPYSLRVLALLLFILCVVAWDRVRGGRTRLRDYAFLLGCGLAGCLSGVLNDEVTGSISPEYFVLGKGIPEGEGFRSSVTLLGAKAGFSAGIVAGAVLLFANRSGSAASAGPALPYGALGRLVWKTAIAAVLLGIVGGALFPELCPSGLRGPLEGLLEEERVAPVLTVWGIHIGLYSGLAAGVVCGVWSIRRRRARRSLPSGIALGPPARARPR